MEKRSLFVITFIFIVFSNSLIYCQTEQYNNQEFKIDNFSVVKPLSNIEKSKLTIKFNITLSNPLTDYLENPYYLRVELEDENSSVIFTSENSIKVNAKPQFGNDGFCEKNAVSFEIPYSEINLSEGNKNVKLLVFAENVYKDFGQIYSQNLFINVPKLYSYNQQEFYISNIGATSNIEFNKVKGVKIVFDCKLKFQDYQTFGFNENSSLGKYYFYVEMINNENEEEISYLKEGSNVYELLADKEKTYILIHIPFNKINLSKGKYKLTINVYARNADGTVNFGKLFSKEIEIFQPYLYYCELKLDNLEVNYKEYDVTSVLGRVFSKSTSDVGKGFPDTYWIVKTGENSEYYSGVNKNSFSAFSGKAKFYVCDSELVSISVYDHDYTSFDDFIGSFSINHSVGNFQKTYSKLAFNEVGSSNFSFSKILIPHIESQNINLTNFKYQGVSGVKVDLAYKCSKLPEDDLISVVPKLNNCENEQQNFYYIDLSDNDEVIENKGENGNVEIFIPFFDIRDSSLISFDLKTLIAGINLGNIGCKQIISIPKISDSKINVLKISEEMQGKINGYEINFGREISDIYINRNKNIISKIIVSSGNEILKDTIYSVYDINSKNSKIFIPFYKLNSTKLDVSEKLFIDDKSFIISENSLNINLEKPEINEYIIKKVTLKLDENEYYENLFLAIIFDDNYVFESNPKPYKKEMSFETVNFKLNVFPKDKFTVIIFAKDKYEIATEIFKKDLEAKMLESGKIKIKPRTDVKQIVILAE